MKKFAVVIVLAFAAILALAACSPKTSGIKAAASSTSVAQDKQTGENLIKPCLPANQLTLATKAGVDKLAACAGVPKSNRKAFENAALVAAEHTPHILSKGATGATARHSYANVTLPALVKQYR